MVVSGLGYSWDFSAGWNDYPGYSIGGKAYIIQASRSFIIGPMKFTVVGTLGSMGAAFGFDPVKWKLKAGYHEVVGLEFEVQLINQ